MPTQSRQLAAIMFTDIVGYTALMGKNEQQAFELLKKNRQIQKPIIEKFNGRWLKEIGDGVLASFPTVTDAVYCAATIQKTCEDDPDLNLRIGIHQGEVVFEGDDVFGDGVNIASRLEPLAPVGGILVSESVHNNTLNKDDIESMFIGEKQLKNVQQLIKVYQVQVEGVELLVKPEIPTPLEKVPTKSRNPRKIAFAVTGVLIILLLSYFLYDNLEAERIEITDKSIAVLPFRNESNDPQNIYFCNTLMEDIISQLSKVEGIRLPSITSMLYYRDNPKPYDEIVEELNVNHLLEGSVRKLEDRVLVNITLIDAEKNEQIWTHRYPMDLSVQELWDIQFEVAQQIIGSLKLALYTGTDYASDEIPTENYQAYDNFLQARELLRNWSVEDNRQAIDLLQEAIFLDSKFHLGFSELAIALCQRTDLTGSSGVDSAGLYAKKSLELKPNSAQSLAAMGYYSGMVGNPSIALEYYTRAVEINPKVTYNFTGWCHWQMGNYENAIAQYFNNLKNDPNNPGIYIDLVFGTLGIGLFDKSVTFSYEAFELSPGIMWSREGIGKAEYYRENYLEALNNFSSATTTGREIWMALCHLKLGHINRARSHINSFLEEADTSFEGDFDKLRYYTASALSAHLVILEGDITNGKRLMHRVIEKLQNDLSDNFPPKFALLAACYASMGMVKECVGHLKLGTGAWFHYYFLKQLPLFDPIRQDDVFQEAMKQIKVKTLGMQERVLAKGYLEEILKR